MESIKKDLGHETHVTQTHATLATPFLAKEKLNMLTQNLILSLSMARIPPDTGYSVYQCSIFYMKNLQSTRVLCR